MTNEPRNGVIAGNAGAAGTGDPGSTEQPGPVIPPLALDLSRTEYRPREVVRGTASWRLDRAPSDIEVRLFWFTRGKGTADASVIDKVRFHQPLAQDRQAFEIRLPDAPYSFSGKLISLIWAVEIVADPGKEHLLREIVIAPDAREIILPKIETAEDRLRAKWEGRLGGVTISASTR
jgi:hypothetical protein